MYTALFWWQMANDCDTGACWTGDSHMTRAIYLANPYGFSLQQKAALLPPIVDALESLGLEVWEPFRTE